MNARFVLLRAGQQQQTHKELNTDLSETNTDLSIYFWFGSKRKMPFTERKAVDLKSCLKKDKSEKNQKNV